MEKTCEELVHDYERDKAIHDCENVIGRLFYYTSTFMTKEIVTLWADRDDCTLELPFGCYDGIKGVRRYYLDIMGDRSEPAVLEMIKGVMCLSTLDTQVLEVAEDRQTAHGAWFSPGMETYGKSARFKEFVGRGLWMWGKVAADFIKEDGEWKLWHMRFYLFFRTDFHESWTKTGDYKGYVLKDPKVDRPPHKAFTRYNIEEILAEDEPAVPLPYNTFADVAPGYGYKI